MPLKSKITLPFAKYVSQRKYQHNVQGVYYQERILTDLLRKAQHTQFGREHAFKEIKTVKDFQKRVPIRDYEGIKPYIERIAQGQKDVLWPAQPLYFAKTSGTTSGIKYIPISKQSIHHHIFSAQNALLAGVARTQSADFVDGQLLFVSGSPELVNKGCIPSGRLSGLVNKHIPAYLSRSSHPKYATNSIPDWEIKLNKIVEETLKMDLRFVGGIPPWIQMYFDFLRKACGGKTVKEIFPNLSVLIYGGVDFRPYDARMRTSIGDVSEVDFIESYPASEGFIAWQDQGHDDGMLLNTNSNLFFEFVPEAEIHQTNPIRLTLAEVELDTNYALVLSNNAGLWAYQLGDVIRFVSLAPYRIVICGRTQHFISAFGEHVIGSEVEQSLFATCLNEGASVKEFTVAPKMQENGQLPHHEWLIEFDEMPKDLGHFALELDQQMRQKNIYYDDLVRGKILSPLKIRVMPCGTFDAYLKSVGKLGGQNKIPHLANDRGVVEGILDS